MNTQKLSISLPMQQYDFLEDYRIAHHYKTRSEVIKEALELLQQSHLETCYQAANQELDNSFDSTAADGLNEDEAW